MTTQYEPYYWLNKKSRDFLAADYLRAGQTAEDRIRTIAEKAEAILKIDGFAAKFMNYMSLGYYSLSTPIWANFGAERGLPISCNGSYIADSMDSILHKAAEIGMMTKYGAGTSAYFGDIRARGTPIKSGGHSFGSVHFMELFNSMMKIVSQSSVRRGSMAVYLPIDHGDIEEFLKIRADDQKEIVTHKCPHCGQKFDIEVKSEGMHDLSLGVCVSDEFMNRLINGDKEAAKIWVKVIQKRFETGYPYIFFSDTVNNNAPQIYQDKGMKIHASNLCVTGDQRVVSSFGLLTAKELCEIGSELELFDNNKTVKASPMQLIEKDADVFKITLENGMSHTITSYHKLVRKTPKNETENIECKDLKIGDSIAIQTQKGLFGTTNMPKEAFLLGLYQADGTQHKDLIMIDVWQNDFDLIEEIQEYHDYVCNKYKTQVSKNGRTYKNPIFADCIVAEGSHAKKRLAGKALKKALNFEKGYVPDWIWESDEETQWQYIKGLYYADGTVFKSSSSGEPIQIALASINKDFLQEVQIILANLGMQSSIRILKKAGDSLLPDGKGGSKYFSVKDCYRLIIGNKNDALVFNLKTGFLNRKNINIEDREYRDNTKKFYKIQSIEYIGKEDVYCTTVESNSHLWICNGFITHNCSEICLNSDSYNSFVCNLSSMNLVHYQEWKDTDAVETLFYFLDAVMSEYIELTKNIPFMDAAHNFAKTQRAIGLGVLGWHSFLQRYSIPFESLKAKSLNVEIHKFIMDRTNRATEQLAKEYGEPELLKGTGRRNVTTMAIAPTLSSSFILGQVSSGIEPIYANYYNKSTPKGNFTYKNLFLKEVLHQHKRDNKETWDSILKMGGSVQHLDFLSDNEREVFKTFGEISQMDVIIQASQRQKYIDQAQSLNLCIHHSTPLKEVNKLMIEAWKLGVKTLYYQRSTSPVQEYNRKLMTCSSCEG